MARIGVRNWAPCTGTAVHIHSWLPSSPGWGGCSCAKRRGVNRVLGRHRTAHCGKERGSREPGLCTLARCGKERGQCRRAHGTGREPGHGTGPEICSRGRHGRKRVLEDGRARGRDSLERQIEMLTLGMRKDRIYVLLFIIKGLESKCSFLERRDLPAGPAA